MGKLKLTVTKLEKRIWIGSTIVWLVLWTLTKILGGL
jgi:hypothetical protein